MVNFIARNSKYFGLPLENDVTVPSSFFLKSTPQRGRNRYKEIGPKSEKEERLLKGAKEGFKEGTPEMVFGPAN